MRDKNNFTKKIYTLGTFVSLAIVVFIVIFIFKESIPLIKKQGLIRTLFSTEWNLTENSEYYGFLPMVLSTIYISLLSCLISIILGLGCAVALTVCKNKLISKLILSFIDMIAGIPSVVFGFIGIVIVIKYVSVFANLTSGECIASGVIVLSIMLLPYVVTSFYESINLEIEKYIHASLSLGVSKLYTIQKIVLINIRYSILETTLLAFSRGIGETMAVMMVIGNSKILPQLFGRAQTLSSLIALEIGAATYKSLHYSALYTAALIIIIIMFIIYFVLYFFVLRNNRKI